IGPVHLRGARRRPRRRTACAARAGAGRARQGHRLRAERRRRRGHAPMARARRRARRAVPGRADPSRQARVHRLRAGRGCARVLRRPRRGRARRGGDPDGRGIVMARAMAAPRARVDGVPVALEDAVTAAADVLVRARLPLVYGLVETTVEAQRLAVEIADLTGGAVDTAASAGHESALLACQRIGLLTATLGEVRTRADLVVFWGIAPDAREPGFRERYLARAADSPARVRVAVDIGKARGPDEADERIAIPAAAEFEALWALRAMVRERRVDTERLESLRLSPDLLRPLAWRLVSCRYGVILHDADPPPERRDPLRALALGA